MRAGSVRFCSPHRLREAQPRAPHPSTPLVSCPRSLSPRTPPAARLPAAVRSSGSGQPRCQAAPGGCRGLAPVLRAAGGAHRVTRASGVLAACPAPPRFSPACPSGDIRRGQRAAGSSCRAEQRPDQQSPDQQSSAEPSQPAALTAPAPTPQQPPLVRGKPGEMRGGRCGTPPPFPCRSHEHLLSRGAPPPAAFSSS